MNEEVHVNAEGQAELDGFLQANPSIQMLEVLMPDINGIFRCKRIHRSEFSALFEGTLKCPATQSLVTTMGEYNHRAPGGGGARQQDTAGERQPGHCALVGLSHWPGAGGPLQH
jgi:hypothetical protein